ncbi:P63C domain-containing protein [uncultured Alsobacter sp.]|uniref:P63C domain-containing protein n=1 Tax=uncultured Alsobacter sp. TaxID=1748258 RepID=UPI0025D15B87|nr:P63C domain-containing protein [uncultured Alsobacter sp.]
MSDLHDVKAKAARARAESLSGQRRKEIARKAADARWNRAVPEAIFGSAEKPLIIGETRIQAYVLDDETRVLTQASFLEAIGRHRKANVRSEGGDERIPAILQGKAINPFIPQELFEKSRPVQFRLDSGGMASGYRAEILPMVCEVYLKARDAGVLPSNQKHVAVQADILIRALAHVGIIALVDEATGYQEVRARRALNDILERFISEELRKWAKTFPDEFYKQMFRLRGWDFRASSILQRPGVVGRYTNDIVYERLAPGVLEELKRKNPRMPSGQRKHKHFQWLTEDVGDPRLREHLASIITLMRASSDWNHFKRMIDRALPRYGHTGELPLDD